MRSLPDFPLLPRLLTWRDAVLHALAPKRPPLPDDWFTDAEVEGFDRAGPIDEFARVDDATWRDLEAKALLARIAAGASIYARQFLFRALRRGGAPARGERPAWMGEPHDAERVLAQAAPARLELRRQDMEVTAILFHGQRADLPAWLIHVRWARLAWLAAPGLALASWGGAGALCVLAWLVSWAVLEMRFHARLQLWKRQRRAVLAMLRGLVDLGSLARRQPHPALAGVADDVDDARRLLVALDLDALERKAMTADYVNLLTLHEYVTAPTRIATLDAHLPRLRSLYATLAECDARLCLLAHVRDQGVCWPSPAAPREMRFCGLRNPLLEDAEPLSLELRGQGVFLSGENGVGKSTFLRAIGLNLLMARAFGFCHAEAAAMPFGTVWSSIVHEDSIATGDSLYMAEMRRGQTLLRVAEQAEDAVFLLDEIFRGTNHSESVAAATAVLNWLAARGTVVVSSHNVVLAPLLRARLAPWRIVRAPGGGLALERGVLREPNGIAMMQRYAMPRAVRAEARRVHDWFAGHIAAPASFPTLD